jgi:hypothetical protein
MHTVTAVMFTPEELDVLNRVKPFIGIGAKSDGQREEWERRWNGVAQRRELITREAIDRALDYVSITTGRCETESSMDYWRKAWSDDVTERFGEPPADDTTFPQQMAEYLSEIRARMVPDLEAAESLLLRAQYVASAKPDDEKYEGL